MPIALVALVVVAWLVIGDARVELAGRDVRGADEDEVRGIVENIAEGNGDTAIRIVTSDGDIETDAAAVGLVIDVDATVEGAIEAGETGPIQWVSSLLSPRTAPVVATVDDELVRALVSAEDPTDRVEPVEPGIAGDEGQIAVTLGEDGRGLDADEVADAIEAAVADGEDHIEVELEPTRLRPRFGRADAEALAGGGPSHCTPSAGR